MSTLIKTVTAPVDKTRGQWARHTSLLYLDFRDQAVCLSTEDRT